MWFYMKYFVTEYFINLSVCSVGNITGMKIVQTGKRVPYMNETDSYRISNKQVLLIFQFFYKNKCHIYLTQKKTYNFVI